MNGAGRELGAIGRMALSACLALAAAAGACGRTAECSIFDFGATNDTEAVQTAPINRAIEYCSGRGGGKVIVPPGRYVTGTLFLKDNVELCLSGGATLCASGNDDDFPVQPPAAYRSEKDAEGWIALVYAAGAGNIAISGSGTIDGAGRGRGGKRSGAAGKRRKRPRNLLFVSCRNVRIEGITMLNAGSWNQHYLDCEDVTVDRVRVYNHCNGNNDGIDIDGCRRFVLSNSIIDSDDDGIVLKSTGKAPCEDVVVGNCIVSSFANAIKCGTESIGGFRNITVANCIVKPSRNRGKRILKSTVSGITAISLEIVDGGVMDGVSVDNILIEGTECPLYVRLADRGRNFTVDGAPPPGKMWNISISNITARDTGNFCASVTGIPGAKIENVYLHNIRFMNRGGLKEGDFLPDPEPRDRRHDLTDGSGWRRYWSSFREVAEDVKGYPQPTVWGNLPCFGLFVRHVETLSASALTLRPAGEEPRIPVIAVDVDDFSLRDLSIEGAAKKDILIHGVKSCRVDDTAADHVRISEGQ